MTFEIIIFLSFSNPFVATRSFIVIQDERKERERETERKRLLMPNRVKEVSISKTHSAFNLFMDIKTGDMNLFLCCDAFDAPKKIKHGQKDCLCASSLEKI